MQGRPDYATARQQAGFSWSVAGTQGALRQLTGIPIRDFNLNPEACIEAYRRGRPLLAQRFGPDVRLPGVSTPAISYGHPNTLGSELRFPEGGEVGHTPIYRSLLEGIEALRRPVDFLSQGMAPFYLQFRERLRQAFPNEPVGFSFGLEGPITTAYELRGQEFFADLLEDTPLALRYLEAVVDSILAYHAALCALDGRPVVNPNGAGMCDDCASFIAPRMWPEVVLPAWERYYRGMTTGRRTAHVEDLREEHLPYLEEIGLSFFDPSISPRLSPPIVARACRVPFLWRLGSFHCVEMTVRQVEDFVYQAAADGASQVVTYVSEEMCNDAGVAKVHAFIAAAKEVKRLLDA
ncbi:MAG: uroporphyrinogen decarboxylase family protein, partial [Armatimonadota bacterium]|nr:uroporphyrinogen decarboxylase family protein [Armatimonadota bacterium]